MGYGKTAYCSVTNSGTQTLTANVRTQLAIDMNGSGVTAPVNTFPDGMRWSAGKIMSRYVGETFSIRYTATMAPDITLLTLFQPFTLHWEFDIGGTFGAIVHDWWSYSSLFGVATLGATPRRQDGTQAFYAGNTWLANGCTVYVTSVGAGCKLTNAALYIESTGIGA